MKYMLIMRATDAAVEASKSMPVEEMLNQMGSYNEELMAAGVMAGGEGLAYPEDRANFVLDFAQDPPTVSDAPYGETEALFNGFWMLEVPTKEDAVTWASKCPLGPGSKLEVRRVQTEEDFADFADNEYIQKEAGWREGVNRAAGGNP
ncbi:YciI family protein [Citricoccus muralis]|uniref:YCII-related domain-containing protein n=1 Tax=Citricoccus muralis TaxID=169134 RepID=A0A3D9LHG1_9MICC|nr:YciI family protein [Citricoccus muralis]REE04503.1 hypothetical protein C8E99_2339 [Citricoccus muralis]